MKRANFYLPMELIEQLKSAKLATGVPVSEIVRRAIIDWLKKEIK